MQGNFLTRSLRLFSHLVCHPTDVPRYFQTSIQKQYSPLDLRLPWYSYGAIDFLEDYLKPHLSVFEYGSGGSTLFFAQRTAAVISVEDNAEWKEKVENALRDLHLKNATLIHHSFDVWNAESFRNCSYLNSITQGTYDVISVDGTEASIPLRPICFRLAEQHIKPGGIIIVDDSWRYPELRVNNRARNHRIFQSIGPCRPGITSTDIFFY